MQTKRQMKVHINGRAETMFTQSKLALTYKPTEPVARAPLVTVVKVNPLCDNRPSFSSVFIYMHVLIFTWAYYRTS